MRDPSADSTHCYARHGKKSCGLWTGIGPLFAVLQAAIFKAIILYLMSFPDFMRIGTDCELGTCQSQQQQTKMDWGTSVAAGHWRFWPWTTKACGFLSKSRGRQPGSLAACHIASFAPSHCFISLVKFHIIYALCNYNDNTKLLPHIYMLNSCDWCLQYLTVC